MKKRLVLKVPTCTLSCLCGAPVIVDGRHPEGEQVCVVCRQNLKIIVSIDPKTKKRRVGILVAPQTMTVRTAAVKLPKAAPKTRVKPPTGPVETRCPCGTGITVDLSSVDAVYTCVGCGMCYTAVGKKEDGETVAKLIQLHTVPLADPGETQLVASTSSVPPPPRGQVIGAQALRNRGEDVVMSCFCGAEISVNPDEHRQDLTCPGCSLAFQVMMAVEPGTHRPMAVTLPKSR